MDSRAFPASVATGAAGAVASLILLFLSCGIARPWIEAGNGHKRICFGLRRSLFFYLLFYMLCVIRDIIQFNDLVPSNLDYLGSPILLLQVLAQSFLIYAIVKTVTFTLHPYSLRWHHKLLPIGLALCLAITGIVLMGFYSYETSALGADHDAWQNARDASNPDGDAATDRADSRLEAALAMAERALVSYDAMSALVGLFALATCTTASLTGRMLETDRNTRRAVRLMVIASIVWICRAVALLAIDVVWIYRTDWDTGYTQTSAQIALTLARLVVIRLPDLIIFAILMACFRRGGAPGEVPVIAVTYTEPFPAEDHETWEHDEKWARSPEIH